MPGRVNGAGAVCVCARNPTSPRSEDRTSGASLACCDLGRLEVVDRELLYVWRARKPSVAKSVEVWHEPLHNESVERVA
jgi:hypothetical protein